MRYSSVLSVTTVPPKPRRRLAFLVCSKWRLPARERNTLPVPVILNRLATAFLVLIPFGRRINNQVPFKKSAQYRNRVRTVQVVFSVIWVGREETVISQKS